MRYRGRHRQVAQRQKRLRRTGTVAVVAASALVAPLAFSGPVASQATVNPTALNTLANHPEWLLSATDSAVAAQIADLKHVLTERGVTYDPAKVVAYRVPTVEGFVTYVTAQPQTFTVQPNPSLLQHTPDGDTAVSAAEVLSRLLEPTAEGDAGGLGIPSVYLYTSLFNTISDTVNNPPNPNLNTLIASTIAALEQYIGDTGPLLMQIRQTIDSWRAEAERIAWDAIGSTGPLVNQVMLTAEAWRAEAERIAGDKVQQALTVLNELDPEGEAAAVVNVVPFANAALPINTGTSVTAPGSQPISQPVDAGAALVPEVQGVYEDSREDERPEWNRNNENCYFANANAWYRQVCWRIDNQINDDTSDKTYWQFNMEASSYPLQKRGMYHVWVEGAPQSGAAAQRSDGIPKPNQEVGGESGCASGSESISLSGGKPVQLGYSYSFSITKCETYTPRGYNDEGHWSNKWHFNPDRDSNGVGHGDSDTHMRNVAFTMGIKTNATDGGPVWNLFTGTDVSKKYCC